MRLLNTTTLTLEEFWDSNTPKFAILSHTWEKEEVTFQAIQNLEVASQLIGISKIKGCCRQALKDGWEWVWVDTCCIDKSSSAELSEAINSMYTWYRRAEMCYAFLTDVLEGDVAEPHSTFDSSRWFTRGWTLQELIAPCEVIFFSRDWKEIGRRSKLSSRISTVTKIDEEVLTGSKLALGQSVAQRMSWASCRLTTRAEDIAYCLMGLFDVNMPLLYGERGNKAFLRLQEEILKRSKDHSLFAWTRKKWVRPDGSRIRRRVQRGGLLAQSPQDFEFSGHYFPQQLFYHLGNLPISLVQKPYSMTNIGLSITLPTFQIWETRQVLVILACASSESFAQGCLVCVTLELENSNLFRAQAAEPPVASHEPIIARRIVCDPPKIMSVLDWSRTDLGRPNKRATFRVQLDGLTGDVFDCSLYVS